MKSLLTKAMKRRRLLVKSEKRYRVPRPVIIKTRSERAADLVEYAEDVIKRTRVIIRQPKVGKPLTRALGVHDKINAALLADAYRTNTAIAAEIPNAKERQVARRRKILAERGTIDDVPKGRRIGMGQRKPERITGHLNEKKRKAMLRKNRGRIQEKAVELLREHKSAFKRLEMGQLKIAKELRERMNWYLQTWPGPKTITVQKFFNSSLSKVAYDFAITAERQAKGIEKSMPGRGKWSRVPNAEKTLMQMDRDCKQMGLNPLQKAVYYALKAKMTGKRIGFELGYSKKSAEPRVSQIRSVVDRKKADLLARREAAKM